MMLSESDESDSCGPHIPNGINTKLPKPLTYLSGKQVLTQARTRGRALDEEGIGSSSSCFMKGFYGDSAEPVFIWPSPAKVYLWIGLPKA